MIKMSIYINILNIMSLSLNFKTIPKKTNHVEGDYHVEGVFRNAM
jgi:hypothetical protein